LAARDLRLPRAHGVPENGRLVRPLRSDHRRRAARHDADEGKQPDVERLVHVRSARGGSPDARWDDGRTRHPDAPLTRGARLVPAAEQSIPLGAPARLADAGPLLRLAADYQRPDLREVLL